MRRCYRSYYTCVPRLVRSVVLNEGSMLSAGRLGRGVRRDATGVAKVKVDMLEEFEVLGDCKEIEEGERTHLNPERVWYT